MLYRITLTAKKVHQCPLYSRGDSMTVSFPRVDRSASDEICVLTLAEFLPMLFKKFRGEGSDPNEIEFKVCHGCELQGAWVGFVVSMQPEVTKGGISENQEEIVAKLRGMSVFDRIPSIGLMKLAGVIEELVCEEGDTILQEGAAGDGLYAVQSGLCLVYQGDNDTHIAEIGPGECFGEMSLLTDQPCSATIRTGEPGTVIYKVKKGDVFELTRTYPGLANYFSKLLAERLKKTNSQVVEKLSQGFSGALSHMSPPELIQAIDATEKGGVLTVKGIKHRIKMEFSGGLIYGIEGSLAENGPDCFYDFLGWKEGSFTFSPGEIEIGGRRPYDPTALLLNGLRMQDEAQRMAS